jgi:hypothetical protein
MEKEFVTYEQALALKDLGFNEPCFSFCIDVDNFLYTNQKWLNYNLNDKRISAPLYQQAFRWFREKHNLCGEVYTVNMGAIDYTFQIRDLYSEDVKHNNFEAYTGGYIGTFLTYEEAEQACLDKLIEICKNK